MKYNGIRTSFYWLSLVFVFAIALQPTSHAANCGDKSFDRPAYPRIIEDMRYYEAEILDWYERYKNAPSYSWEREHALKQLNKNKSEALRLIHAERVFYGIRPPRLHRVAKEIYKKYLDSASYSVPREFYLTLNNYLWGAFGASAQYVSKCRGWAWERLVKRGDRFYKLYLNSPSYSKQREAYLAINNTTWDSALEALKYSIQNDGYHFGDLERLGLDLREEYINAPSYSKKREVFLAATNLAFNSAFESLRYAIQYMSHQELYNWQAHYSSAYKNSPSYSQQREFYLKAKNLIERKLDRL